MNDLPNELYPEHISKVFSSGFGIDAHNFRCLSLIAFIKCKPFLQNNFFVSKNCFSFAGLKN